MAYKQKGWSAFTKGFGFFAVNFFILLPFPPARIITGYFIAL